MEQIKKLRKILDVALDIQNSDLDEEKKYDMIFSEKISRQVYSLFNEINVRFEYYDPDTSYEEDVNAFVSALEREVDQLIDNQEYSRNKLISRYNKL